MGIDNAGQEGIRAMLKHAFEKVIAAFRILAYGQTPTTFKTLTLDEDGHLQVDVLSLSAIDNTNIALTSLEAVYNTGASSRTSTETIDSSPYRMARLSFTIVSAIVSNHFFTIEVYEAGNGTDYTKTMNGPLASWVYDDTVCATAIGRGLTFPICSDSIEIKMFGTNISGSESFTISNADIYLRE